MCGRYAASANPDELLEEFEVDADQTGGQLVADYNLAPTKVAPVVLTRVPRELREDPDAAPQRQLRLLTWGLVPSWAKDRSGAARLINARVESLFDKPAFRRAAAARRAIVPADGWYEWRRLGPSPRAPKQPYFMTRRDGDRVAMAGIYEFWRDPTLDPEDPNAWLTTFAVLTTAAEPGLAHIHDRMPLVLDPARWAAWLDPAVTQRAAVDDLVANPIEGRFEATPVSALVSNVANNGPDLVRPTETEAVPDGRGETAGVRAGEAVDDPLPGL